MRFLRWLNSQFGASNYDDRDPYRQATVAAGHLVLRYRGRWIDSTFRDWRDELAPHSKRLPCSPVWVLFRVMWGKL